MAKTILFFLLIYTINVSGQHKPIEIKDIKLNITTTSFIDSLAKEKSFVKRTVNCDNEFHNYAKSGKCIIELLYPTDRYCLLLPYTEPCKKARAFYIPGVNLSDIDITGAVFVFYKDSLASMRFDYSETLLNKFLSIYGSDWTMTLSLNGAIERFKFWTDSTTHEKLCLSDLRRRSPDITVVPEHITLDTDRLTTLISACNLEEYRKH